MKAATIVATGSPLTPTGAAVENIASAYGDGNFGRWTVDPFGLPAYLYTGLGAGSSKADGTGPRTAQIGNDNITGFAFDQGYVQLYSQARLMQWANAYDPHGRQFAGGYGYLRVGHSVISTLYPDRPAHATEERLFGVGYLKKVLRLEGLEVTDITYAPFGDDPVLLHEIIVRNLSTGPVDATWFEYWGVNPLVPASHSSRGLRGVRWSSSDQILSVRQQPGPDKEWGAEAPVFDTDPLAVFAAPIGTSVRDFESSTRKFFGSGTRARPQEVVAGRLSGTLSTPVRQGTSSEDMLGFSAPIEVGPGASITLRFIYGFAAPKNVPKIVAKYRGQAQPLQKSIASWRAALPRVSLGNQYAWVAREVTWAAYLVRSASVYEEVCGYHTITQGGYYQYALGYNWGTRSWTHYILPMLYLDPGLAREILRYTAHLQPAGDKNLLPYGTASLCTRSKLPQIGSPNDSDAWFIFAALNYALATRDLGFFQEKVPFFDTPRRATIWEHLKLAFRHQQSLLGPHGGYLSTPDHGTDWSDGLSTAAHQTESLLVTSQVAYEYPLLADVADEMGDTQFASEVRPAATGARRTMQRQWVNTGWYARGYDGNQRLGQGILFEEPQPWTILAGIPSPAQDRKLIRNIRRFLTGIGAPTSLGGPATIGSAQVPARADPDVTERCQSYDFSRGGKLFGDAAAACWIGGNWFDLNGNLVWALASLDGELPEAASYAWGEYLRNSLAVHATVFPNRWDGIVSVDDVCTSYYDTRNQGLCGLQNLRDAWDGEIAEQPTWMVMGLINLAGWRPTPSGYVVDPQLPVEYFDLALPTAGLQRSKDGLRGYFLAQATGDATLRVKLENGLTGGSIVRVDGRVVQGEVKGQWLEFTLPLIKGRTMQWAVMKPVGRGSS